ncbi:unnamed protein product [Lupinus luteus]|uniref:Uncharacterized protein n=1 Tax=Lupinus luteus TaxID=3873 RepID=A0AAV1X3P3_LUPLU
MEDIADQPRINSRRRYCHWLLVATYAVFVLLGHSAATLLGRLYYEKGGKSKWMFTPYIINSLLLLTISSTLLVFQANTEHSTENSKKNHVIGLICTVAASAGEGLLLSVRQFAFEKVLKKETFKVIMDMIICESLVATCVILVGLFASGEWKGLHEEMEEFELGKASYLLNLIFTAINWQLYCIGCVGLVFEVSSLFSNSMSALGLPIVPISAVIIFHEKMQGIKAISMVLALWGFISYLYHHYLDDRNSITESRNNGHVPN